MQRIATIDRPRPPRILIRLPNWVGDIAMAAPAVDAVRATMPTAHLVGMARLAHCELAARIAALDEVIAAPARRGLSRVATVIRASRRLRSGRFDAAVLMVPSFEAAFTAWLAGIPRRIGSATDRRGALLTEPVAVSSDLHRSDGFAALVAALGWGVAVDERATPLVLTGDDRGYAGRLFRDLGWPDDVRPLFVNPAAAKTPRAWSTARFRELVEVLGRTAGRRVIVHGRPPFDAPPDWAASHGVALVSDATLPQMCALLERCALYVGNDSGPAHLASILGVSTVTVFGSSTARCTGPRASRGVSAVAVSAGFECSPCRERFFTECPSPPSPDGRPPCLEAISVEQVVDAVERALALPS